MRIKIPNCLCRVIPNWKLDSGHRGPERGHPNTVSKPATNYEEQKRDSADSSLSADEYGGGVAISRMPTLLGSAAVLIFVTWPDIRSRRVDMVAI
jgi:hypothetical protein